MCGLFTDRHGDCLHSGVSLAGVKCLMVRRSQKAALTDMFAVYYSVNVMSSSCCHKCLTSCSPGNPDMEFWLWMFSCCCSYVLPPYVSLTQRTTLAFWSCWAFAVFLFPNPPLSYCRGLGHWKEPAGTQVREKPVLASCIPASSITGAGATGAWSSMLQVWHHLLLPWAGTEVTVGHREQCHPNK